LERYDCCELVASQGASKRALPHHCRNGPGHRRVRSKTAAYALLRRIGDQDLMGAPILFASDAGKHITGLILAVDGDLTAVLASG
jgi:hypothetical protein